MAIDENTSKELAELALKLSSNPKTRKAFLKLTKEAYPDTPIPEIDVDSQIEERVSAVKKEADERIKKIEDDRLQERLIAQRQSTMREHGLDETQMKSMEEMITKGELPADYKWAGKLFKQQIEPVGSTSYTQEYGPLAMPSAEGLMENESRWSVTEAHKVVDELRAKARGNF